MNPITEIDKNAMKKKATASFTLIFRALNRFKMRRLKIQANIHISSFFRLYLSIVKIPESGVIELEAYYTWMDEEGFARTVGKAGAHIELKQAMENTEAVFNLPGDHNFPIIIDARFVKSISKEARDHFSLKNRASRTMAFAIIVDSPLSRIIANFFIGLNKPAVPVRLFTDEETALKWCRQLKKKDGEKG